MDDTNNDTYEQIKRYLQNRMSKGEMHDFEKAMLEDPFLSDAVEGYRTSNTNLADEHLKYIAQNIPAHKQQAKVVPISNPLGNWAKVAAIVVVMAGASYLAYQWVGPTAPQQQIAVTKPAPAEALADTASTLAEAQPAAPALPPQTIDQPVAKNSKRSPAQNQPAYDAATTMQAPAAQLAETPANTFDTNANATTADANNKTAIAQANQVAGAQQQSAKQLPASAQSRAQAQAQAQASTNSNSFKGKVLDPNDEPVAFAQVVTNNKTGVITDRNGNFTLTTADSTETVTVTSIGYQPLIKTLTPTANNKLVLQPAQQSLSEVVVTGLGIGRKRSANKKSTPQSQIKPQNGWQSYQAYVTKTVQSIQDTSTNYISGQVQLSFTVNQKGEPQNITIVSSTNAANNPLAVAIVKQGPLWQYKRNKAAGFITISF